MDNEICVDGEQYRKDMAALAAYQETLEHIKNISKHKPASTWTNEEYDVFNRTHSVLREHAAIFTRNS